MIEILLIIPLGLIVLWAAGYGLVIIAIVCVKLSDAIKSLFNRN